MTHADITIWLQTHGAPADLIDSWERLDGAESRELYDWANSVCPPQHWGAADLALDMAEDLARYEEKVTYFDGKESGRW